MAEKSRQILLALVFAAIVAACLPEKCLEFSRFVLVTTPLIVGAFIYCIEYFPLLKQPISSSSSSSISTTSSINNNERKSTTIHQTNDQNGSTPIDNCSLLAETKILTNEERTNQIKPDSAAVKVQTNNTQVPPLHTCDEKSDEDYIKAILRKEMSAYELEKRLPSDLERAIRIRRKYVTSDFNIAVDELPYENIDYSLITEACCENVLGYVPIPLGYAGPLKVDGQSYLVPMATTEGALIASTNRGCRAISSSGGCETLLIDDSMTRAPVIEFDSLKECAKFQEWMTKPDNFRLVKQKFDSTSNGYLKLQQVECTLADLFVFIRFSATTGDAMGMNMVSKGTEAVLKMLKEVYFSHTSMRVVSLSGNYCSDKKSAAVNWIKGRGKNVIASCTIPAHVVSKVLKTDVTSMVHLHTAKNQVGSALSGSLGGFNAHAANMVTAIFIACGQDVAQTVSSSQCLTTLTKTDNGDLRISCNMRCLEVGTVGGGTVLKAQKACLKMLGCAGGNKNRPGANAEKFARIICSAVVAGELSLLAALTSGDLVKSHMKHNRSMARLPVLSEDDREQELVVVTTKRKSSDSLSKLINKASSSTSSLAHPESCSKVLT